MSNEPRDDNLLVDQNEALDFYFDSMLLPDENDFSDEDNDSLTEESDSLAGNDNVVEKHASDLSSTQQNRDEMNPLEQLQSAKDFLQISKQRQQKKIQPVLKSESEPETEPKPIFKTKLSQTREEPLDASSPVAEISKVITKGSISPKPGEDEAKFKPTELVSKKTEQTQSIVFSNKNDDGKLSDQVLIPRSRRLAALKQKTHAKNRPAPQKQSVNHSASDIISTEEETTGNTMPSSPDSAIRSAKTKNVAKNIPLQTNNIVSQATPLEKESIHEIEVKNYAQEAPNLDLSLFLPKIKTLSDTEIAQQIEALTQAAVTKAQVEQSQQVVIATQAEADEGPIRNIDNAPSWAVPSFQVLLFAVAGLKMAVPLNELNGIVEWGDEYITELPGHKSWYLGIIQNQGKNVPVIDTLQQVVPKERWPAEHLKEKNFKHIILIDNSHWGLACETVLEVVTLKTDSVKWRSSRTKRRWLLGTVIEHMCALLDSSEFAAMLKTGDDSLVS